ncbi:uncharacterized protein F5Z01DRAFT_668854 [Emericellopsis atlantica]|uniref:Uncharacterized protein n=1 Tax=Emericellopsis atlantica TaxID=2614577 RepID=A0A9P7ZD56_9HYPO|nr:uncharacterized protein F5Z01DRAFT_668854 [Emericellopsis atlantica]KAG9249561.1 hypothetical protein F5Z01DRAFT_668854 [Emericellopsis atlantica]
MLHDLGSAQQVTPIILHTNSQNAKHAILNSSQAARTRHIDIRFKWIIAMTQKGTFTISQIGTTNMAANGLTKPLLRYTALIKNE